MDQETIRKNYERIAELMVKQTICRSELLEILTKLGTGDDAEGDHKDADNALLSYINDPEITEAYEKIRKWYA